MKKIIRKSAMLVLSVIAISSFVACDDDSSEDIGEPQEPKMINIGFGISLTPQNGASANEIELHTFIKDGYTVVISGGISPNDEVHTNVNLEETLMVEVVGDIVVTVSHPDFNDNTIDTVAYFGIKDFTVDTSGENVNIIDLELVQGYVLVTAENGLSNVVTSVLILGQPVVLDVVYYTNAPLVDVIVETTGNTLTAQHTNVLGEGVQYMISSSSEGIEFTFPEFGTPGDGVWFP